MAARSSGDQLPPAYGVVKSFDDRFVFVSYGGDDLPMRRDELDWADTEATSLAIDDVGLQPEVDHSACFCGSNP